MTNINQPGVTIRFKYNEMSEVQRTALSKAEDLLRQAGIYFDTGTGFFGRDSQDGLGRDWEFDWSLKGPIEVCISERSKATDKVYIRVEEPDPIKLAETPQRTAWMYKLATESEDEWVGDTYATREEAMAAGRSEHPGKAIKTAFCRYAEPTDFVPNMNDALMNEVEGSDYSNCPGADDFPDLSKEDEQELQARVDLTVSNFFEERGISCSFGLMEEVQVHEPEEIDA